MICTKVAMIYQKKTNFGIFFLSILSELPNYFIQAAAEGTSYSDALALLSLFNSQKVDKSGLS